MSRVEGSILERTEAELRAVIDHLPVGIVVRHGSVIAYANQTAARSFGIEPAALVGRSVLELMRPEYRDGYAQRIAATERGETIAPSEFRFDRADGRTGTMEVSGAQRDALVRVIEAAKFATRKPVHVGRDGVAPTYRYLLSVSWPREGRPPALYSFSVEKLALISHKKGAVR